MSEEWPPKQIDKYIIVNKKLGSGAFGTLYRGFKNDETKQVAVKAISIASIKDSSKMVEHIKLEISILQQACCQNTSLFVSILEYCHDGDLKKYLSTKYGRRLSQAEAVIFLKHLVEGFRTLHQLKIIHRDIKPANILLHKGVAKITDFDFARVIDTGMNGTINSQIRWILPIFESRISLVHGPLDIGTTTVFLQMQCMVNRSDAIRNALWKTSLGWIQSIQFALEYQENILVITDTPEVIKQRNYQSICQQFKRRQGYRKLRFLREIFLGINFQS